jgi:hypothetical protein
MRRRLALLTGLALCVGAEPGSGARADTAVPMQRVVIDRVELEPSPIMGYARLRVFVNAVDLAAAGKVMEVYGDHGWKLQIAGGAKSIPYLAGLYGSADVNTAVVLVVETSSEYGNDLPAIKDALDQDLLQKLPAGTQVAVVGYGEAVTTSRLGSIKNAQAKLASLQAEPTPGQASLLQAIDKALSLLKHVKTDPEGQPVRKLVIVVSDGRDKGEDRDRVTSMGKRALKEGVRIDPIAYQGLAPSKGPLLNLGELAKQSNGNFRWAQAASAIGARVQNAELEIDHQYVLTWLVPPDEVAGKKLSVVAQVSASQSIESNDAKVPTAASCAGTECPEDTYCAADHCVKHAAPKGTSVMTWILAIIGVLAGAIGLLAVVGLVVRRARRPKPPGVNLPVAVMQPGPTGAVVPAPVAAPAAAPAPVVGPQLYFMTGPRTGERIALRHGFLIGKQPGCDLVLDQDGFASSQHAQILMDQAGNCTLVDKGSTNGTFVNGVRVTQYALTHGVAIRVGSTELRFLAQ